MISSRAHSLYARDEIDGGTAANFESILPTHITGHGAATTWPSEIPQLMPGNNARLGTGISIHLSACFKHLHRYSCPCRDEMR
ncbi:hypothetical protein CPB86DRAFT_626508 [Serendipita vermifera]|nr:hypothetical protein CPB86DRAFT_626508 [Serendipita vermifera]